MSNSNSNKKEKIGGGSGDIVDVAAVVAGEDGTVEATSPSARNNGTTNATILATAVAGNADAATPTVIVEPQTKSSMSTLKIITTIRQQRTPSSRIKRKRVQV